MFRIIVHIILFLALSALIGGIIFFGAGVASVVFRPDLLPSRTLSGAVNAAVLHRLNVLEGLCAAILPLALGYLAFTVPRAAGRIAFGLSIAILVVVLYVGLSLFPEVNALRLEIGDFDHILAAKEALLDRFDSLHKLYTRLTQGILIASLLILISQVTILSRALRPKNSKTEKRGAGELESHAVGESGRRRAGKSERRIESETEKRGAGESEDLIERETEKGRVGELEMRSERGEGQANGEDSADKVVRPRSSSAEKT